MPDSDFEWKLIYLGVGYLMFAAIMAHAVIGSITGKWSKNGILQKIVANVINIGHFALYITAIAYLLPFIFEVAEVHSKDTESNRMILYAVGFLTLIGVLGSASLLNKRLSHD